MGQEGGREYNLQLCFCNESDSGILKFYVAYQQ